jgi:predicted dehydrogenase
MLRDAVVGLGHIAQAAVLPASPMPDGIRVFVAVVGDDSAKRKALSRTTGSTAHLPTTITTRFSSSQTPCILLPNSLHAEYTVGAARAGMHVLCEKPTAVTADECHRMIDIRNEHGVKLMVATGYISKRST